MLSKLDNAVANAILLSSELYKRIKNKSFLLFEKKINDIEDGIVIAYKDKKKRELNSYQNEIKKVYDELEVDTIKESDSMAQLEISIHKKAHDVGKNKKGV